MEIIRRKLTNNLVVGSHSIIMTDKDLVKLHSLIEEYMNAGGLHKDGASDSLSCKNLASAFDTTISVRLLRSMSIGQQVTRPVRVVNRLSIRSLITQLKKEGMRFSTKTNQRDKTFTVKRIK